MRQQRVITDLLHGLMHRALRGIKTGEPALEVDTAVTDHVDTLLLDASRTHLANHLLRIHVLRTAISMADHHDLLHT